MVQIFFHCLHSLSDHPDYLFPFIIITKNEVILWRREVLKDDPHQMSHMLAVDRYYYSLPYSYFLDQLRDASPSWVAETCQ